MKDTQLTLKLEGPSITVDVFRDAILAFAAILHDATERLCPQDNDVNWMVEVVPGSVVVNVTPHSISMAPPLICEVVDHVEKGFFTVSQGGMPAFFSDSALRQFSRLASLSRDGGTASGVTVRVQRGTAVVDLSADHSAMIDSHLGRQKGYADWGSVEGKITSLSLAKGYHFTVTDILLEGAVSCSFDPELLPVLLKAFGRRVMVSGLIHYNTSGDIKKVEVEDVDVFRPDSDLPTAHDVRGILAGGV